MIVGGLISFIVALIPFLGVFICLLVIVPIIVWFSFVGTAAIGVNNHSIGEAFALAKDNLTAARAAKVLGIGILVLIVMAIIGFIIGLLSGLISVIPGVGPVLGQIVGAMIGAIFSAFLLSGGAGLYYRYTDSIKEPEEQFVVTD